MWRCGVLVFMCVNYFFSCASTSELLNAHFIELEQ